MLVINFYGGPSAGKSSACAGLFYKLKTMNANVEMVREYAKELAWRGDTVTITNQLHLLGVQFERLTRLEGKADIAVCDSPILLSSIYAPENYPSSFHDMVKWAHKRYDTIDVILERTKPFNPIGRIHDEEESKELDIRIQSLMDLYGLSYVNGDCGENFLQQLADTVIDEVMERKREQDGLE